MLFRRFPLASHASVVMAAPPADIRSGACSRARPSGRERNAKSSTGRKLSVAALFAIVGLVSFNSQTSAWYEGRWVKGPGPAGGIVMGGSFPGKPDLPICRAKQDGGWHPGKVWQGSCWFEWGWADVATPNYEVLLKEPEFRWVNAFCGTYGSGKGKLRPNAVFGGDGGNAANHEGLGVCSAYVPEDGIEHPGKFYKGYCNIAWGGGNGVDQRMKRREPGADGHVSLLISVKNTGDQNYCN
jgi:hypothetical protein